MAWESDCVSPWKESPCSLSHSTNGRERKTTKWGILHIASHFHALLPVENQVCPPPLAPCQISLGSPNLLSAFKGSPIPSIHQRSSNVTTLQPNAIFFFNFLIGWGQKEKTNVPFGEPSVPDALWSGEKVLKLLKQLDIEWNICVEHDYGCKRLFPKQKSVDMRLD